MAKPMLVTLPFALLLLDWWPLQRISNSGFQISNLRPLIFEKIPFFMLSAVSSVITFIVQQKGGAVAALVKYSMVERIENTFVSYARYLGKTVWPDALANPYPHPGHWEPSFVMFSVTLILGLSAIAVLSVRKFPFVFTGWFWFIGTLIPVIGLVQVGNQAMADRYSYLPLTGIFIIFAWGLNEACMNWHLPKPVVVFLGAIILLAPPADPEPACLLAEQRDAFPSYAGRDGKQLYRLERSGHLPVQPRTSAGSDGLLSKIVAD